MLPVAGTYLGRAPWKQMLQLRGLMQDHAEVQVHASLHAHLSKQQFRKVYEYECANG